MRCEGKREFFNERNFGSLLTSANDKNHFFVHRRNWDFAMKKLQMWKGKTSPQWWSFGALCNMLRIASNLSSKLPKLAFADKTSVCEFVAVTNYLGNAYDSDKYLVASIPPPPRIVLRFPARPSRTRTWINKYSSAVRLFSDRLITSSFRPCLEELEDDML